VVEVVEVVEGGGVLALVGMCCWTNGAALAGLCAWCVGGVVV